MNRTLPFARVWAKVTLWGLALAVGGTVLVSLLTQALAQTATASASASAAVAAAPAASVPGATMAHSCAACHGTYGRLGDESFAPLAGMPVAQFVTTMTDFREGRRPSTLMGHVAQGFSDAEIRAMGEFFAAVSAVEGGRP